MSYDDKSQSEMLASMARPAIQPAPHHTRPHPKPNPGGHPDPGEPPVELPIDPTGIICTIACPIVPSLPSV